MYFMLIEVLDWQSKPTGDLRIELALSCKVGMSRFDHPFRKSAGASYFLEPYGVPEHYDSHYDCARRGPAPLLPRRVQQLEYR